MTDLADFRAVTALSKIEQRLQAKTPPAVAQKLIDWMALLSPTGIAPDYFTQRTMFPMLLLPEWMAAAAAVPPDCQFQTDLAYSTVNGYYFIRMLDNVMDDHATVEGLLLPMSAFFHCEFQGVYQRYFDSTHPFWKSFESLWLTSASAVCREATSPDLDLDGFCEIAAKKLCAAKIPLAALHYYYGENSELESWLHLADRLAEWWQFLDDLMDWNKDEARGACTYFLCEGRRRKHAHECLHEWVAREGFQWGIDTLNRWMRDLKTLSVHVRSNGVAGFLDDRIHMLDELAHTILPGMKELAQLAVAMGSISLESQPDLVTAK